MIQKKHIKKKKKILNDKELDLYIKEKIEEELEIIYQYYNDGINNPKDIYAEEEYIRSYNLSCSGLELKELKDLKLLFKLRENGFYCENLIRKEIKKIENKYNKKKEKYREQEIKEVYYEN